MAYTAIDKHTDYFNTKLYTGTASQQAITGVGFQPDFTWIKRREVNWHCLVDAVRGATKRYTDGFTVGIDSNGYTNQSGGTYVSWNWKESATAGFDIVTYTGNGSNRTISHSLSAKPHIMLIKDLDGGNVWTVYHHSKGATHNGVLSETYAFGTGTNYFQDTEPTTSVFSVGTSGATNTNTRGFINYLLIRRKNNIFMIFTNRFSRNCHTIFM